MLRKRFVRSFSPQAVRARRSIAARTAAKIFDFILLILLFYLIVACNFGKMTRIVSVSFLQSAVILPPIFSVSSLAMDNPSPVELRAASTV